MKISPTLPVPDRKQKIHENTIFLRGARQLLTLRGPHQARRGVALQDLGVIEDGSLLIRNGEIAEIGSTRRIENLKETRHAEEIPVYGKVVMPAFVDAGLYLNMWHAQPVRRRKKNREFTDEIQTLLGLCLQYGTLTVEAKVRDSYRDRESVILALRSIAKLNSSPIGVVPTWHAECDRPLGDDSVPEFEETVAELARKHLVEFIELATDGNRTTEISRFFAPARRSSVELKLVWPGGPVETLIRLLKAGNPRAIQITPRIERDALMVLSKISSIAVVAPFEELIDRTCATNSIRQLVNAGAPVALASGYSADLPASINMQMAVGLAAVRLQLTPEEAISAATINAAWSVGVGRVTGSLEIGKQANVLVMNLPDYRELIRQFGVNHVGMAIRAGQIVLNRTAGKNG